MLQYIPSSMTHSDTLSGLPLCSGVHIHRTLSLFHPWDLAVQAYKNVLNCRQGTQPSLLRKGVQLPDAHKVSGQSGSFSWIAYTAHQTSSDVAVIRISSTVWPFNSSNLDLGDPPYPLAKSNGHQPIHMLHFCISRMG